MASDIPTVVANLWYDDGNVVLQAEASLFRVSLAAHSPVFDDIRKLPQPEDQEMHGDCPLIILRDEANDLGNFLRAVYNSGFFEPPPTKTDLNTLAGVLRLSTKYGIIYLRKRAIRHLDTIACNTLDARHGKRTITTSKSLPFRIADLAREMDLPWLLPSALYTGTIVFERIGQGYMSNGEKGQVDSSQRAVFDRALRPLIRWHLKDIWSFLYWTNVEGCASPARCNEGRLQCLQKRSTIPFPSPLARFSDPEWADFEENVCTRCGIASRTTFLAKRETLWEALPVIFDLPSWGTLRSLREQALNEN